MSQNVLKLKNLTVSYETGTENVSAVKNISLDVDEGEVVGIIGESGSGKSTLALAITGLLPDNASTASGSIILRNKSLSSFSENEFRTVRGEDIGFVFQDPFSSLNPTLTVSKHFKYSQFWKGSISDKKIFSLLRSTGFVAPEQIMQKYPHQLSGGMAQRVCIALAAVGSPSLIIADEPTSALDAALRNDVMSNFVNLTKTSKSSMLLITHDIKLIKHFCDKVVVMKNGELVEKGLVKETLLSPKAKYTQSLLRLGLKSSSSDPSLKEQKVKKDSNSLLLKVENLSVSFKRGIFFKEELPVLKDVSFCLHRGETIAVVGESGSGKTTLGKSLLTLITTKTGKFTFFEKSKPVLINEVKYSAVLQNPLSSLNPALKVKQCIFEPLSVQNEKIKNFNRKIIRLIEQVGLSTEVLNRFPSQLSGGQRQRVSLARALISNPDFILFDEPTSALDAIVQEQVLQLIKALQKEYEFGALFITHDLSAAEKISDRIIVMKEGEVVEVCATKNLKTEMVDADYTKKLILESL